MKLSEHFSLSEMTRSDYAVRHGIDNTPNELIIANLKALCEYSLEPLREIVKKPIHITSGYRCYDLNKAVGGSDTSQHVEGKAVDIVVYGSSVEELHELTKYIPFDQAINEFNGQWLHLSYSNPLRRMKLWAVKIDGKTKYLHEKPEPIGA